MIYLLPLFLSFLCLIFSIESIQAKEKLERVLGNERLKVDLGMVQGSLQMKYKPETFYLKNVNLLNNNNPADKIFVNRHTIDYNIGWQYGKLFYGYNPIEFFATARNKAVWGNPESIAQTTESTIKTLEVVFGTHKHFITRNIPWIRELWLDFCINDSFGVNFKNKHRFRLGAFPFELGRGIALGSAYAVGPRVLGFYSDNAIDQYAYGFRMYGDIFAKKLSYDLYAAILENKSDSFTSTGEKILGQEYGRKLRQERGPGKINFIIATRYKWFPIKESGELVAFEPYILYNSAPEQRVEFLGDANSKLATLGLAGEFELGNLEWGFDTALNFGRQVVKGWDRNKTEDDSKQNSALCDNVLTCIPAGVVTIVNSHVHENSPTGPKVIYVPNSSAQQLIENSAQNASQNGLPIGMVDGVTLFNDINRFRNPYSNKYKGWMFVADGIYNFNSAKTFRAAAMVGAASGDKNPNQDLDRPGDSQVDGDFKGFIGLQELYYGYRVQSAFLLGGTGRVPRPLFIPTSRLVRDRLPVTITGFTNLIFLGSSVHWYPTYNKRLFSIRPNILAYWQQFPTNAFDRATNMSFPNKLASNYLGVEANIFADFDLLPGFDSFKIYAVGSVFIPGTHFKDIKGTPLTKEDLRILDKRDVTGITNDMNPLLGDDIAYTMNFGLELRF